MSRSDKARHGTACKFWKDSVLASRSQKRAWSKRKQLRAQQDRARGKATLHDEIAREAVGPSRSSARATASVTRRDRE